MRRQIKATLITRLCQSNADALKKCHSSLPKKQNLTSLVLQGEIKVETELADKDFSCVDKSWKSYVEKSWKIYETAAKTASKVFHLKSLRREANRYLKQHSKSSNTMQVKNWLAQRKVESLNSKRLCSDYLAAGHALLLITIQFTRLPVNCMVSLNTPSIPNPPPSR